MSVLESAPAMDDVWFGRDAIRADFDVCTSALPSTDVPFFAVRHDDGVPRLLLASRMLFKLFGVGSGEALSDRFGNTGQMPRRFAAIARSLQPNGAPRLERLRFYTSGGTEMVTFLCRLVMLESGPVLVAAAILGIRHGRSGRPNSARDRRQTVSVEIPSDADAKSTPASEEPARSAQAPSTMNIQSIQAMLRARWQTTRKPRFTWQTDAEMICWDVSQLLADIVGDANAELVGRDIRGVAAQIDPMGRFAAALERKETWSGLQVSWPLTDAAAALTVDLGAIPVFDRNGTFEGYRGYGVLHLDSVVARDPIRLAEMPVNEKSAANVIRFGRKSKALSEEDRRAFVAIGEELREETGLASPEAHLDDGTSDAAGALPSPSTASDDRRSQGVAKHGLSLLERMAVGVIVSRDNVPIFVNRHALEILSFESEDALYAAGGLSYLFDGPVSNVPGQDVVRVRDAKARPIVSRVLMQTTNWDGLPATLLTILPTTEPGTQAGGDNELRELRAILETATDGVAVIDADCNILSLNRSGEALFGCDRSTVIGKPFLSLFAEDNQSLASAYLEGLKSNATQQLLNDGREILIQAHPGGTIPVFMTLGRLSAGPASDSGSSSTRFCALFRDLTHWKKVEQDLETAKQEAERANDLKSDFLAKVSHEVRTPLNAIIGFAEVMMEERFGPVGSDRYKDYLRDIHASGTHVMSLVNDLLDLSKIEAGKMELAVEVIDVNRVIGECVAIMQPQASAARVIMRLSLSPTLPRIKADERSVRQIALNVLSNAIKFNEPGGQVIVATTTTEGGQVVIRFRDTGQGMSETDVASALEPFRQLATARSGVGGTGLGLPLTKALVEANQAAFSIRSKTGQGTLVEIAFPPTRVLAE